MIDTGINCNITCIQRYVSSVYIKKTGSPETES